MAVKRNKYGVMKGLAITGVVAGHAGIDIVETFVNYWHLPVFFFVSGYFLKPKHLEEPKRFIRSRVTRLIIPFLLFAAGALLVHNLLAEWHVISGGEYGLSDYLKSACRLLLLSSNEQMIGAMWFLPALFIVSVFGILAARVINRCKYGIYIVGGVILLATVLSYAHVPSPYSVWQYISISWIFILGYYCARTQFDIKVSKLWIFVISVVLLLTVLGADMHFGLQASMINNQSLLFPLVFVAGILVINYLATLITDTKIGGMLAIIGDFSFSIMALHFVGFKILTLARSSADSRIDLTAFPVDRTDIYYWMPVYLIAGIAFSIALSLLYSKIKDGWRSYRCIQES